MKILLINHFPLEGSGSGVYVANIAQNLVKRGHDVCIIMPENTTKIKEVANVKIHPVYFKGQEAIEGQVNFNFPCMDPHPRSGFLFEDMTNLQVEQYENAFKKAIEQEMIEFNPDIIHAQHIWIISSILKEYNKPIIITSHGSDIMGYNESDKYHIHAKRAAKDCKKIVTISNHNKEEVSTIFEEHKHKIITIANGYDKDMFYKENCSREEVLKSFNINNKYDKIVCFAGRLAKNKGIDILLHGAEIYEKENVLTLIAGHGSEYEVLFPLKEKLGLKNVVFLGDLKHEQLRKLYSISDVCVVPSRKEAFGLVALEAIACGLPVVATRQGGIPDFVNEKVGILVEEENVEQLAHAIIQVLYENKKFDKDYLQKYAVNNYSQEKLMDKLIQAYEEIKK